ncbi:microtubule-actin cross-linking factor 1 isoform 2 [Corchorus olitorius]|uniref:Microtubule-actin cross-linking factor 1 isoform 2 n=1 Tax=Corchorus olitorius TaxID=93759 RepID=A0A1R3K5J9_9ROSI|nr:microtubule-actin cross-linking factor 1 isoform 2 [Corchorus olitorius]
MAMAIPRNWRNGRVWSLNPWGPETSVTVSSLSFPLYPDKLAAMLQLIHIKSSLIPKAEA